MKALILDATWRPINFVKQNRAITMLLSGKVDLITTWDCEMIRSINVCLEAPAIIRLKNYVGGKFGRPRFRRKILFTRDSWTCQYCGSKLGWKSITVDHVIPKSKGGKTTWENCVSACLKCNEKKGSKSLRDCNMDLLTNPREPKPQHFWNYFDHCENEKWHPGWTAFLRVNERETIEKLHT